MTTQPVALALTALLLSACAMAPEAAPKLEGTAWALSAAQHGDLAKLAATSGVTLEFAADRLSGYSGCNQYSASYTLDGKVLTAGAVGATKRRCGDDPAKVEQAWFAALAGPLTLTSRNGSLELRDASDNVLTFKPGVATGKP